MRSADSEKQRTSTADIREKPNVGCAFLLHRMNGKILDERCGVCYNSGVKENTEKEVSPEWEKSCF